MVITARYLRIALFYQRSTGLFFWRERKRGRPISIPAGTIDSNGYCKIRVRGVYYLSHRLAWLYMTGAWPTKEVDHKNRNPSDNRWRNLRVASRRQNNMNSKMKNKTGYKGVNKQGTRYRAQIKVVDGRLYLGRFSTAKQAHAAYAAAAKKHFGEFARAS